MNIIGHSTELQGHLRISARKLLKGTSRSEILRSSRRLVLQSTEVRFVNRGICDNASGGRRENFAAERRYRSIYNSYLSSASGMGSTNSLHSTAVSQNSSPIENCRNYGDLYQLVISTPKQTDDLVKVAVVCDKLQRLKSQKGDNDKDENMPKALKLLAERAEQVVSTLSPKQLIQAVEDIAGRGLDPTPIALFPLICQACSEHFNAEDRAALLKALRKISVTERESLRELVNKKDLDDTEIDVQFRKDLLDIITQGPAKQAPQGLIGKAQAFWEERLLKPARQMTSQQLGVALSAGLWGGVFPIPGATTAIVVGILAFARISGRAEVTAPMSALAVGLNLVVTPLQLAMMPVFMIPFSECAPDAILAAFKTMSALQAGAGAAGCLAKAAGCWALLTPPALAGMYFATVSAAAAVSSSRRRAQKL